MKPKHEHIMTVANEIVALLISRKPSRNEARDALDVAKVLYSSVDWPMFTQRSLPESSAK